MGVEGWEQKRIRKGEYGFGGEDIQIQSFFGVKVLWKNRENTKKKKKMFSEVKIYHFSCIF